MHYSLGGQNYTNEGRNILFPTIRNPRACKFATNGKCSRGNHRNYTHPWDMVLESPVDAGS